MVSLDVTMLSNYEKTNGAKTAFISHYLTPNKDNVLFCSVPLPPSGELRVRDITHSTMVLYWDAAPGPVRKYLITYKPQDGEAKEVSLHPLLFFAFCCCWALMSS